MLQLINQIQNIKISDLIMNLKQESHQILALPFQSISDMVCGNYHSVALCEDQLGIWVWGKQDSCNLGIQLQKSQQKSKSIQQSVQQSICQPYFVSIAVKSASAGNQHTYIWKQNQVYCWGSNKQFKLGLQEQKRYQLTKSQIFVQAIEAGMQLSQISCGDSHSLAVIFVVLYSQVFKLQEDDQISYQIFAWGESKSYQLALQAEGAVSQPIMIDFNQPVKHVYSRSDFNYILTLDGDCYAWGTNLFGRLGFPNSIKNQKVPTKLKNLTKIKSISMGKYHCIAITQKQQAYSWGHGMHGQLVKYKHTFYIKATPTKIQISQKIVQASCGEYHSIILTQNNQLMSCGSNAYHALGHNQVDAKKRCKKFVKINIPKYQKVAIKKIASGNRHNLLLTHDGKVFSWGCNKYGQLGRNSDPKNQQIPIKRQLYKQIKNQTTHNNNIRLDINISSNSAQQIKQNNSLIQSPFTQSNQNQTSQLKQSKLSNNKACQNKLLQWKQRYEKFKREKEQQQQKFMFQLQQILKQMK